MFIEVNKMAVRRTSQPRQLAATQQYAPALPPIEPAKLAVPITVPITVGIIGLVLTVAVFLFNAGGRVGSNDKDLAYLAARVDALTLSLKDANDRNARNSDHDAVIRLDQRVASLEASDAKNTVHVVEDSPGKK